MNRKKAISIQDVKNIQSRNWIIIKHPYDRSTRWNDVPMVLHIFDREGEIDGVDFLRKPTKKSVDVSRCNRVSEHWDSGNWMKVNSAVKGDGGFKFCTRCGTPQDFIDAMNQWDANIAKRNQEYDKEQKAKQRDYELQHKENEAALAGLGGELWNKGFEGNADIKNLKLTIVFNGRKFAVTIAREE